MELMVATNLWEIIVSLATAFAAAFSAAGLIFLACQPRRENKVSRNQFMLELKKMFLDYDDIHAKLRPDGAWNNDSGGAPKGGEDWTRVESYMGLFEHCKRLLDDKLLSEEEFCSTYLYRLRNLADNKQIVEEKLKSLESEDWKDFISLLDRFGVPYL